MQTATVRRGGRAAAADYVPESRATRDGADDPLLGPAAPAPASTSSALLGVLVLMGLATIGLLVAAVVGAYQTKDAPSCQALVSPPGADFSADASLIGAVYQFDAGTNIVPPDAILAVGQGSIVMPSNVQFSMFNADTLVRTEHLPGDGRLWEPHIDSAGDGYVVYDVFAERIIYENWDYYTLGASATYNGTTTNVALGNYAAPTSTSVTAELIAAVPPTGSVNGVPTLTNAAACAGKIVVFLQGGILSYDKAQLALAAGAAGMIFVPTSPIGISTPSDTRPPLPLMVVGVPRALGLEMLAGLGMATLTVLPEEIAYNSFGVAISKNSTPKVADDWWTYVLDVTPDFPGVELDFPKLSVDARSIYITTQAFNLTVDASNPPNYAAVTFIIDKAPLLEGPSNGAVSYRSVTVPNQGFLWPAVYQAPLSNQALPMLFVGTDCPTADVYYTTGTCDGNVTALRIYSGDQPFQGVDALTGYVEVPLPTPMQVTPYYSYSVGYASQPPPVNALESIADGVTVFTPVVRGDRLWCALAWSPAEWRSIVRWFELDLSRYLSHGEVSLVQWGDLSHVANASTAFPAINVDVDGNMAIAFLLTSSTQPPTLAYAGRFADDPAGTVRVPYETPLPSEYAYEATAGPTGIPRYGDYSGLAVDPRDGRTFYATVEHPSQLSSDVDPEAGVSYAWTCPIVRFRLERAATPGGPQPALGPAVEVVPIELDSQGPSSGKPEGQGDPV